MKTVEISRQVCEAKCSIFIPLLNCTVPPSCRHHSTQNVGEYPSERTQISDLTLLKFQRGGPIHPRPSKTSATSPSGSKGFLLCESGFGQHQMVYKARPEESGNSGISSGGASSSTRAIHHAAPAAATAAAPGPLCTHGKLSSPYLLPQLSTLYYRLAGRRSNTTTTTG